MYAFGTKKSSTPEKHSNLDNEIESNDQIIERKSKTTENIERMT